MFGSMFDVVPIRAIVDLNWVLMPPGSERSNNITGAAVDKVNLKVNFCNENINMSSLHKLTWTLFLNRAHILF